MKLPAMIHIDLDSLRIVAKFFDIPVNDQSNIIYTTAVERFLDLFDEVGIKTTFFIVGDELENQRVVYIMNQAITSIHEIANHTLSHQFAMS